MVRGPTGRDPRLDFFRGIAMFIILIAHIPGNAWARWIPARFGPSDATEMFVFCSGFAAAIAFGGTFVRRGFWMGCGRVLYRCWQIYWAHLSLFFVVATICVLANLAFAEPNYISKLNLTYFFNFTAEALVGLFTLTYVPNYFDILPMYFVALLMMPLVIALHRLHVAAAIAFCVGLWLTVQLTGLSLPAEPWSDRPWFFNPFAWQLIFFTGFMLSAGWIKPPPVNRWLVGAAVAWVVFMVCLSWRPIWSNWTLMQDIYGLLVGERPKTNFHWIRWVHFLALAYLAVVILKGREHILLHPAFAPIIKVGQQALATFLTSMAMSWTLGIALDQLGRSWLTVGAANLIGFAVLIGVAYLVGWYKKTPWKQPRAAGTDPAPRSAAAVAPAERTGPTGGRASAVPQPGE